MGLFNLFPLLPVCFSWGMTLIWELCQSKGSAQYFQKEFVLEVKALLLIFYIQHLGQSIVLGLFKNYMESKTFSFLKNTQASIYLDILVLM